MNLYVLGDHAITGNMVRGAMHEINLPGLEVIPLKEPSALPTEFAENSIALVDWDTNPDLGLAFIKTVRKKSDTVPILLLCTKAKAGTTFIGMKAGAGGVINKPFDPDEIGKAIGRALKQASKGRPKINVEYINPFIESTRSVFSTMCSLEIERKKLFLKDDFQMFGDISGVMGLTGEANGSVVISLPAKLACKMVAKMLGTEPSAEMDQDVRDGVGEVINMISGQAKAQFVKTKYHFTLSIPSVVTGSDHEISHPTGTGNIVVLFECEGDHFAVQVCLAPNEEE